VICANSPQWDRNLKQQGFMAVFERQYGDQNGATHAATVTRPRGDRLNADS
jgi:poly(3-hydroxybutyrate) depolymerase